MSGQGMPDSGRVVLRVVCSKKTKRHQLAAVRSTGSGYILEYRAMVRDGEGNPTVGPARADPESDGFAVNVFCGSCRQIYVVDPLAVFDAARAGRTSVVLMSRGMLHNPLGVLRRKHEGTT